MLINELVMDTTVTVRLTGEQFKIDDPDHYGQIVEAEKLTDITGNVYYEFGDGAFVGYLKGSQFPEYEVEEVAK